MVENPTQPSTSLPSAPTKKDQPTADITAQLKKVKADISIWDIIHTSAEHREAFLCVFQAAHVSQTIKPTTLESMVGMIAEPQVISFSNDELPLVGTNHNQPLFVTMQFKNFRILLSLVDNGSGLSVCPLRTVIKLGFKAEDIMLAIKGMIAFDNTHHDSLGILIISLTIGPVALDLEFYILNLKPNFNLLLGCLWLHKRQVIPLTLQRLIKFRWGDGVIVVMAENFEKERIEAVSSVSSQTVQFDSELSNALYHVNRSEPVNFIPDLERVNSLAIHNNLFQMVENVCHKWGYVRKTSLRQYGQGIAEPIVVGERRDSEGLRYDL